jgi:chitodextrinase
VRAFAGATVRGTGRRAGLIVVCLLLCAIAAGLTRSRSAQADASCATGQPTSGEYSVALCLTAPAPSATVTGTVQVTAAISVTGTNPGVRELVFTLNGSPLLTDFQPPYSWALDSTRWVDGAYSVQVYALMRDGYLTPQATATVNFSNGLSTPPVNSNSFTPTPGTPEPGQPLVVAAVGDGGSGETAETNVVNLISSWHPDLFLYLGDVYENGRPMEFNNWYGQPGTSGAYGQFYSISDPTVGNHEYIGSDLSGYEWYWNNVPHYYSFNAGGWHLVSLDDVSKFIGSGTTSNAHYQAEATWLDKDLTASTLPCTLVYYHEPLFNVGPEGSATQAAGIWKILAQHHVTLVLNGHDHDYQRWVPLDGSGSPSPTGVTEIIDGSGGHGHQTSQTTDSRLAAADFTDFGALRLTLNNAGAAYQFVTTAGKTVDSGSVACPGAGSDSTPPSQPQNLAVTAISRTQVQLSWAASADNVGVTGYTIYRNGTLLATIPPPAGYLDLTAQPGTSYSYCVVATDAAGNTSAPSSTATVTTPTDVTMFSDGFETNDMSQWTTAAGMYVQSKLVNDGAHAAEARPAGGASYAYRQLSQTWPGLYYSTRFYVASRGGTTAYLMRLRTSGKAPIVSLYLSPTGKLAMRNDVTGTSTVSSLPVSTGTWHTLELSASIDGTSSQTGVWLDGAQVGTLTGTRSLGTSPIGYLQLGDTTTGRTFDIFFDDVRADPLFIQP